jgi:hypothetical protein
VPFLCPGLPNQIVGEERWAEPGSLEDSCPSYAQASHTNMEAQKGWAELGSLDDSCPSNALARPTKIEVPSGVGGRLVKVWRC